MIRSACLLLSLLSWLTITVVDLAFLTTQPLRVTTNPQTGDPVIVHSPHFVFGSIGHSKPFLVPVNVQTKMVAAAIVASTTLGLAFFVFLLLRGKPERSDEKGPSRDDRTHHK